SQHLQGGPRFLKQFKLAPCRCAVSPSGASATAVAKSLLAVAKSLLLRLMTSGCERRYINGHAHGVIAGVIGVQIVPRQLSELAVGYIRRLHVAGGRVECRLVKVDHSVKESVGANVMIDLLPIAI